MYLSDDIEIVRYKDKPIVRIYNYYTNEILDVHREIFNYLMDCKNSNDFSTISEKLDDDQIEYLLDAGVLIEDLEEYRSRNFELFSNYNENLVHDDSVHIDTAYIHITFKCNLRCKYCYQKNNLNIMKEDFKLIDWEKSINILKKFSLKKAIFTGGEPFLNKDIYHILKYCIDHNIETEILTNGMSMDFDLLKNCIPQKVIVSLDTLDDSMRKGVNTEKVFGNILKLKNLGTDIQVRSVVVKGFEYKVLELGKKLKEIGINHITTMFIPNSLDEIEFMPDYKLIDLVDENCVSEGCSAAKSIVALGPNGDMYPCQNLMNNEFKIGNILDCDIESKLQNCNINSIINSFNTLTNDECVKCHFNKLCSGGCRASAYHIYGDFNTRTKCLCDYYKKCVRRLIKNA